MDEVVSAVKRDLLLKEINLNPKQVALVVASVLDTMTKGAADDGNALFGKHKFEKVVRAARTGRDFQNKRALAIPETTIITYSRRGA